MIVPGPVHCSPRVGAKLELLKRYRLLCNQHFSAATQCETDTLSIHLYIADHLCRVFLSQQQISKVLNVFLALISHCHLVHSIEFIPRLFMWFVSDDCAVKKENRD